MAPRTLLQRLKGFATRETLVTWAVPMPTKKWRRKRDSNPREPFDSNGFQDRRIQPLCHSSVYYLTWFHHLTRGVTVSRVGDMKVEEREFLFFCDPYLSVNDTLRYG